MCIRLYLLMNDADEGFVLTLILLYQFVHKCSKLAVDSNICVVGYRRLEHFGLTL